MHTMRRGWSWLFPTSKFPLSLVIVLLGMMTAIVPAHADTTYTFQGTILHKYQGHRGYVPECDCTGEIYDGEDIGPITGELVFEGSPVNANYLLPKFLSLSSSKGTISSTDDTFFAGIEIFIRDGNIASWLINMQRLDPDTGGFIPGDGGLFFYICSWCNPAYGQELVGFSVEGRYYGSNSHGTWTKTSDDPPDPLKSLGGPCGDTNTSPQEGQSCGNPINTTTGNKYETETDYKGAGAFPLGFTRFYNSQSPVTTGPLGANWSHSYSAHITSLSSTSVQVVRADQKLLTFTLTNGQWIADADVNSRLTQTASGWRYTTGSDRVETYDATGTLLSIAHRTGLTHTLTYNAQGLLTAVTDPFGRTLTFTYNASGHLTTMTDPAANLFTYLYGTDNTLLSVVYPDSTSHTYLYENTAFPHALTGLLDENSVRFATWTYDSNGLATSSEHAGGVEKITVVYDITHGATSVTDARNGTRSYAYKTAFGVAHTKQADKPTPSGTASRAWTYDANGNSSSTTDYAGTTTTFTHDASRNLELSRTEAAGTPQARTITTTWHSSFRLPLTITEPTRVTNFTYDAQGNLLTRTITAGSQSRTWSYQYNANGQVTQIDGPRTDVQDVTRYAYDAKGNLSSITDAVGHITTMSAYDAHGRPLITTDPNGLKTTFTYDLRGRLLVRKVGKEKTTYTYDKAGQLLKRLHPNRSFESFTYDAAHRLTAVTDHPGNRLVYTRNLMSNILKVEVFDPKGTLTQTRSQTFDVLNRLAQALDAQGQATTYQYDNNDRLTQTTDPLSHTITQSYDPLNRMVSNTDGNGAITQYHYDTADNLLQVTDPLSHATTYSYDGLDNRVTTNSPDTGLASNTYDDAGNVVSRLDARGQPTTFTYDALNRPTSMTFAGGTVTFTYDQGANGSGHLTQMTDPTGQTNWSYDALGRMLRKTQKTGSVSLTVTYKYNGKGQLATITYPSGAAVKFTYTKGKVTKIAAGVASLLSGIQYQPFGPPNRWTWGNKTVYLRQFDQNGRMADYDLGPTQDRHLTYDTAGRITQYADTNPVQNQQFGYDAAGQLTDYAGGGGAVAYDYDLNGNRTSLTASAAADVYLYPPDSNRLSSLTGTHPHSYTYDAAGNITGDGGTPFVYDGRGRMVQAGGAQYKVNGLGQRVGKPGNLFVYDEAGHLLGEYNAQGQAIAETVYLGDMPMAVLQGTNRFFVYADHLNAPRTIINASNAVVWRWDSEPFGTALPTGTLTYNLRFPGQYFDVETGFFIITIVITTRSPGGISKAIRLGWRVGVTSIRMLDKIP